MYRRRINKKSFEQIKPFKTNFHFNERVQEVKKMKNNWIVKNKQKKVFNSPKYNYCWWRRIF